MDPSSVLEGCPVVVASDTYAVVTADGDVPGAFATIDDGRERTHVVPEARVDERAVTRTNPGWTLLTFDVVLPFGLVGFLAVVASALAERDVAVFVLSAYSTDHVLVAEDDAESALAALSDLGCDVRRD
ncbi:ACT domain-containing protein [Halogeometricum sp. CBA1124]|uniref:ACT domain-containing protein n=1 Tax=Halogeometricum sp. CBA1124 TaxID=2668071 RepID=UPI00142C2255|nr:ACT domain-containing protein [Halogeometricum sp. CBA1124]MUV56544.1 ACT domain-containing protein [Halogeometricum sp. CBA1124]